MAPSHHHYHQPSQTSPGTWDWPLCSANTTEDMLETAMDMSFDPSLASCPTGLPLFSATDMAAFGQPSLDSLDSRSLLFSSDESCGTSPFEAMYSTPEGTDDLFDGLDFNMMSDLPGLMTAADSQTIGAVPWPTADIMTEASFLALADPVVLPAAAASPISDADFVTRAFPPLDAVAPAPLPTLPLPFVGLPLTLVLPSAAPSPTPSSSEAGRQFVCFDTSCSRSFPTLSRLRKHEDNHRRPFVCPICQKRHGAKKDMHRHLWTRHPEDATRLGIPSPMRTCPVDGCGYKARQDNLTRHIKTRHPGWSA